MIEKRRVLVNALAALVQVVVSGGAYFVLYRFLYDTIGIAQVGIWATVLTTTSLSHLANLGLSGSTLVFVSKYLAQDDAARVDAIVETSVVSIGLFMGVVLLGLYPLLRAVLPWIINDAAALPLALRVLPYALGSFWLVSVGGVLLSAIDGFERVDLRNALSMVSVLAYLGLSFALVPSQGLLGLALAQVLQGGLLCGGAWLVLKRLFAPLPALPFRWRRDVFREMLGYNVQFQAMTLAQMLFDPTTRALMARLGGLEAAGFFELAYKMVVQLRSLIVTAHQAIVPTIARLQETAPTRLGALYKKSYGLLLFLILPLLPLLLALMPVVSRLYLGAYEATFVVFADLLVVGWFLNILSAPAYFANLGTGTLRWNIGGHVVAGVLNAGLGAALGWLYGGTGVVVGFVGALLAGSAVTAFTYEHRHGIRLADLYRAESLVLGGAAVLGAAAAAGLFQMLPPARWSPVAVALAMAGAYAVVVAWPLWRHPMRPWLLSWLGSLRPARSPQAGQG